MMGPHLRSALWIFAGAGALGLSLAGAFALNAARQKPAPEAAPALPAIEEQAIAAQLALWPGLRVALFADPPDAEDLAAAREILAAASGPGRDSDAAYFLALDARLSGRPAPLVNQLYDLAARRGSPHAKLDFAQILAATDSRANRGMICLLLDEILRPPPPLPPSPQALAQTAETEFTARCPTWKPRSSPDEIPPPEPLAGPIGAVAP